MLSGLASLAASTPPSPPLSLFKPLGGSDQSFEAATPSSTVGYPGSSYLHPKIHFTPSVVSDQGGWHDIAGCITHKGVHHVYQGTGWNHALSTDLVHWQAGTHGPKAVHETYAGMVSYSDPCSGFITKDPETGDVCAGFRQCGSSQGVAGGKPWDVPLELRCALDDDLKSWNDASPEYLFNVSFWRGIPYDPARPWREANGNWYQLLSMDGCNVTGLQNLPCHKGGMLGMWTSPALRGAGADWSYVGPVFETNATVLKDGFLSKEFVTIDYVGKLEGDPTPTAAGGTGTRLFLNNVGGNGGGDGCCSGTTSYFVVEQEAGGLMKQVAPGQLMADWGAFSLRSLPVPYRSARRQLVEEAGDGRTRGKVTTMPSGLDLLSGTASRGLSMARTLGSEEADQVNLPGRKVLIGWTGPAPGSMPQIGNGASAQSLPRELSLAPDRSLLQRFVPELKSLRTSPLTTTPGASSSPGLQAEVYATLPAECGEVVGAVGACGVSVFGDGANATTISLMPYIGLVVINGTLQGNEDVRGGPLPPPCTLATCGVEGGWRIHAILDHSIIEVIVNNATAFVVYASPASAKATQVAMLGGKGKAEVWPLKSANNLAQDLEQTA